MLKITLKKNGFEICQSLRYASHRLSPLVVLYSHLLQGGVGFMHQAVFSCHIITQRACKR